jgi:hypothetical protein
VLNNVCFRGQSGHCPKLLTARRGAADRGEHRQAAGVTKTEGPGHDLFNVERL